jgi:hypothetical protein
MYAQDLEQHFMLQMFGDRPLIVVGEPDKLIDTVYSHGIRFRYDGGDIVVLARPHEQGKYWRLFKGNYQPGINIMTLGLPHAFTRYSWSHLPEARRAVWQEACTLYGLVCNGSAPHLECASFIEMMEGYCQSSHARNAT